jgi:hypothetical protein
MLFDFLSVTDNYEDRKVDNFQKGELEIDTCAVTDADKPFETGICHPGYNEGEWVIVELYDTKEESQKGHKKWVKKMTNKKLPTTLKDVSSAEVATLKDTACGEDWRDKKMTKESIEDENNNDSDTSSP